MANGQLSAVLQYPDVSVDQAPSILPLIVSGLNFEVAGRRLLDCVSFVLQAGTLLVVLGPNGAGKSLLLRLCDGLLTPTAGTIDWNGRSPAQARHYRAMVFQRPVLLRRSAAANIAYALGARGVARRERKDRVAEALARTGLTHLADRPARVLSGGEQQRLAIARAWALQPQVLFLDEPTANLDPAATRTIEQLIRQIRGFGTTIMMTTHNLGQARRLAHEVLFLHHGRLLEQTAATEFFAQPRYPEAAAFLQGDLVL
ncbi:MAG: ATP-binding cassette domain-containing protein [Candidatus Competibacteraceae bacterium]